MSDPALPTSNTQLTLTEEALKAAKFRGPTRFADGRGGLAQQDFECVDDPRFGYSWRRESRKDRGRQFYTVDGKEVADLTEACRLLALPEDPESPRALLRQYFEDHKDSPRLNYGASTGRNQAENNASAGPFGTVRAWMQRASSAWHGGINAWAETERKAGKGFADYRWIYNAKHAMNESYRGVYLFEYDRRKDTGLTCALGKKCRTCPILSEIEKEMEASKAQERFPSGVEDSDIDAAKVATCIGHILQTKTDVVDGAFFSTKDDRHDW